MVRRKVARILYYSITAIAVIVLFFIDEQHNHQLQWVTATLISTRYYHRKAKVDYDDDDHHQVHLNAAELRKTPPRQPEPIGRSLSTSSSLSSLSSKSFRLYLLLHQMVAKYSFPYLSNSTNVESYRNEQSSSTKKEQTGNDVNDTEVGDVIIYESKRRRMIAKHRRYVLGQQGDDQVVDDDGVAVSTDHKQQQQNHQQQQNDGNTICPMISCGSGMELIPNCTLLVDQDSVPCESVIKASNEGYFSIEDCSYIFDLVVAQNTCHCRPIKTKATVSVSHNENIQPRSNGNDDDDGLIVGVGNDDGVFVALNLAPSSTPSLDDGANVRISDFPTSSPTSSSSDSHTTDLTYPTSSPTFSSSGSHTTELTNLTAEDTSLSSYQTRIENFSDSFHPPYPLCVLCVASNANHHDTIGNTRGNAITTTTATSNIVMGMTTQSNSATLSLATTTAKSIFIRNRGETNPTYIPCDDAITAGYLGLLSVPNCKYLKKVISQQNACGCQKNHHQRQRRKKQVPSHSPSVLPTIGSSAIPSSPSALPTIASSGMPSLSPSVLSTIDSTANITSFSPTPTVYDSTATSMSLTPTPTVYHANNHQTTNSSSSQVNRSNHGSLSSRSQVRRSPFNWTL